MSEETPAVQTGDNPATETTQPADTTNNQGVDQTPQIGLPESTPAEITESTLGDMVTNITPTAIESYAIELPKEIDPQGTIGKEYGQLFANNGLDKEKATALLNQLREKDSVFAETERKKLFATYDKQVMENPRISGNAVTLQASKQALENLNKSGMISPELRQVLNETGVGRRQEFIEFAIKLGNMGSVASSGASDTGNVGSKDQSNSNAGIDFGKKESFMF